MLEDDDECQQAEQNAESQIPANRFGDDEQRRIIALDMAIRVRGDADDESIVKTASTFESFLKGESNV